MKEGAVWLVGADFAGEEAGVEIGGDAELSQDGAEAAVEIGQDGEAGAALPALKAGEDVVT